MNFEPAIRFPSGSGRVRDHSPYRSCDYLLRSPREIGPNSREPLCTYCLYRSNVVSFLPEMTAFSALMILISSPFNNRWATRLAILPRIRLLASITAMISPHYFYSCTVGIPAHEFFDGKAGAPCRGYLVFCAC